MTLDTNTLLVNESKVATALEGVQWTQEAIKELQDNTNGDLSSMCFTLVSHCHGNTYITIYMCMHVIER